MAKDDDGIRSYGPGKFYKIIDGYAFEIGVDEEASYPEGGGWHGLVLLDKDARNAVRDVVDENRDTLTHEERDLLDSAEAIIFFERSDGIVEAEWFEDEKDAESEWAAILEETEEEEEEEP